MTKMRHRFIVVSPFIHSFDDIKVPTNTPNNIPRFKKVQKLSPKSLTLTLNIWCIDVGEATFNAQFFKPPKYNDVPSTTYFDTLICHDSARGSIRVNTFPNAVAFIP
ncbi:Uncharacterized protein TCM_004144 [Theobroma cacao]|uniref:Uncharacterized protein n=1 Tax=Theobroma cacao TaxID=3641 RepID=A0A061DWZ1_THECC|nr:Uncharacterized protein TCM_004144 [Theobroma cacao]